MAEKHWIVCGSPDNWDIALDSGMWGLVPRFRGVWRYLEEGDRLLFYATSPVAGMIGFGRVGAKFRQDRPLWPQEVEQGRVLYPFRFELQFDHCLPANLWRTERIKIALPVGSYAAINFLGDQDVIDGFYDAAAENWHVAPPPRGEQIPSLVEEQPAEEAQEWSHDTLKNMIFEIGRIHRYIAEKEYSMNGERLDVVWRRVERSVPTYVFEVQVAGDAYHALAKLKHAYDLWNSNIFFIVGEAGKTKADELLSGTFHEVRNVVRVVHPSRIERIHALQVEDEKLRREIGLP